MSFKGSIAHAFFLVHLLLSGCSDDPAIIEPSGDGERKRTEFSRHDGEFVFADGSAYSGEMVDGKPDGFGKRRFLNGDAYEGDFRNGRQYGEGTMVYRGNSSIKRYDGAWAADKRHGHGTLESADGSIRKGLWINGSFGRGTLEDVSDIVYAGLWEGEALVRGTAGWPDGSKFTGTWENGAYKEGTLVNAEGDRYVGSFA
ncbi:MAG: hypothetical protein AAEJ57_02825, partial [Opitutales bacterium]